MMTKPTHLDNMKRVEPMSPHTALAAGQVWQKTLLTAIFRSFRSFLSSQNAIRAAAILDKVAATLPPQKLVKVRLPRVILPK